LFSISLPQGFDDLGRYITGGEDGEGRKDFFVIPFTAAAVSRFGVLAEERIAVGRG
jgi:hypothetical protein